MLLLFGWLPTCAMVDASTASSLAGRALSSIWARLACCVERTHRDSMSRHEITPADSRNLAAFIRRRGAPYQLPRVRCPTPWRDRAPLRQYCTDRSAWPRPYPISALHVAGHVAPLALYLPPSFARGRICALIRGHLCAEPYRKQQESRLLYTASSMSKRRLCCL